MPLLKYNSNSFEQLCSSSGYVNLKLRSMLGEGCVKRTNSRYNQVLSILYDIDIDIENWEMEEWLQMGSTMGAVDIELFHVVGIGKYAVWSEPTLAFIILLICLLSSKGHLSLCLVESWLLTHHMHITNQLFLYTKNYMKYFYIWTFTSMQGGSFFARQGWLLCKCYFRQPCKRRQSPNFAFQRNLFLSSQLWPFKCLMSAMKLNT